MAERENSKKFVEDVLGRKWDNFPQRVAATYYLNILQDYGEAFANAQKKRLKTLISDKDLEAVIQKYYGKT